MTGFAAPAGATGRLRGGRSARYLKGRAAFRAANYPEAEQRFRVFFERHADDPRAEDAMFLRARALSLTGDAAAAAEAARDRRCREAAPQLPARPRATG
jgi:TolA-binding protein